MSYRPGAFKIGLVLTATSVLLVLAGWNVFRKSRFELLEDGVFWEEANGLVLATRVDPEGPAGRAGLEKGDVIVSFNGNAVPTYSKLVSRLLRWHPGDKVRLAWVDAFGRRDAAIVALTSGPPQ